MSDEEAVAYESYEADHYHQHRRSDDPNGEGFRVRWSIVVQVVGWILGLALVYNTMTNRITALETRVDSLHGDVMEVRSDVKQLLMRGGKQ